MYFQVNSIRIRYYRILATSSSLDFKRSYNSRELVPIYSISSDMIQLDNCRMFPNHKNSMRSIFDTHDVMD